MVLGDLIDKVHGLRSVVDGLELLTAAGRRWVLQLPFMTDEVMINKALRDRQELCELARKADAEKAFSLVKMKLMQVKDVQGSINFIAKSGVKDDVELFEIKHLALLSEAIRGLIEPLAIAAVRLPELDEVVSLLDPEGKRLPSFHIYDAYSAELADLRMSMERSANDLNRVEELRSQIAEVEDQVRDDLSVKLRGWAEPLTQALDGICYLDFLLAHAQLVRKLRLTRPTLAEHGMQLQGLFNPAIDEVLRQEGQQFQAVDISLHDGVTMVVGANMAGKSVLLKTVALLQYLMQLGFFVPALEAQCRIVDMIYLSLGDGQDADRGLSSFGAEMLQLNDIINRIEQGKLPLVLLDELARTTNPTEGKAIVSAMVQLLQEEHVMSLITTHYSGIQVECRRLRVKGFQEERLRGKLDAKRINDYMDYGLEELTGDEVPCEAIRIAEILGVNKRMLDSAKEYLK